MATLTVKPPTLHPKQREIAVNPARFKVLAAGRRWGKTRLATTLCTAAALEGGRAWWVAPSFPIASIGWRILRRLAQQVPGVEIREGDRRITYPSGGTVTAKSADNPDSLRGEGLDFVALDEFSFMKEAAWAEALRPALADRQGRAIFISTPKGRNFFWRLWQRAQSEAGWRAWRYPTSSNPHIPANEIEAARTHLPERIFSQEFLAEFVDDAGGVFRGVMKAATAEMQEEAQDDHQYIFGVDWGKHADFTAIAVLDTTDSALVAIDRFNQIDYAFQVERLRILYDRFQPMTIIAERNSMGEPLIEQLQRDDLPVQPFTTTNASKTQAIEALALALEREDLSILANPVLVGELQAYEAQRLPSGMLRYNAPSGMHDDTVIALALAWHGVDAGQVFPFGYA